MALAEVRERPVHMAHRIVVAQMEQMKVNFRARRVTMGTGSIPQKYPDSEKKKSCSEGTRSL